jgi:hypothetical protein
MGAGVVATKRLGLVVGTPNVDAGKEEKVAGEVEGVGYGEGGGQVGQFGQKPLAGVHASAEGWLE